MSIGDIVALADGRRGRVVKHCPAYCAQWTIEVIGEVDRFGLPIYVWV